VRDGGTFTVRRVIARQDEREILTAMVSFQIEESGFEHQLDFPGAPEPETLSSEQTLRENIASLIPGERREQMMKERAIEIRPVNPVDPLNPEVRPPHCQNWLRARGIAGRSCPASGHAGLRLGFRPAGHVDAAPWSRVFNPGMQVASLDHAIWFHRPLRMDDWLLYDMDSPSAASGRGMNQGTVFSRDGSLVASVAQEALIRRRERV